MAIVGLQLFVITLLVYFVFGLSRTVNLKMYFDEESPPGTVVVDMVDTFGLQRDNIFDKRFKLLDQKLLLAPSNAATQQNIKLVALDDRTGIITLRHRVDREQLCKQTRVCMIKIQAVMLPQNFFSLLNLEVVINDINDNQPLFPTRPVEVNVSESVSIGEAINLDQIQAQDLDIGNNSDIVYSLSHNQFFNVNQFTDEAGRKHLQLIILNELDYERSHIHHVTLSASDQGEPSQSDHVTVRVHVLDENDNEPVFEKQDYVIALRENLQPGKEITRVRAEDADSGENGRTVYYLADDLSSPSTTANLIKVDRNTGSVTLRQKLDREVHDGLRVRIEASDCGNTVRHSTQAWLILHVEDVNDNAPTIHINYIVDANDQTAYISEGSQIGTYLAYVSSSDADRGPNGDVKLSLWTQLFTTGGKQGYSAVDTGHFVLAADGLIGTGKSLDREVENLYMIVVSACDRGSPPRCTFSNITVNVIDENDNSPVFEIPTHSLVLPENTVVGTNVISVTAVDDDAADPPVYWKNVDGLIKPSKNGDVSYSIAEDDSYFSIGSKTGRVTLIRSLDHEGNSEHEVTIVAKDGGQPYARQSSCILKVTVTDINDNTPFFKNPSVDNYTVYASILSDEIITRIEAVDYDSAKNGNVQLELSSVDGVDNFNEDPYTFFVFDAATGDLRLNLTRTDSSLFVGQHYLLLKAYDHGTPPRRAKTSILVYVLDTLVPSSLRHRNKAKNSTLAEGSLSTEFFIIVLSLAAATILLLLIIAFVVFKCKRKNKKVRTYNCRDAESKNQRVSGPKPIEVSQSDDITNRNPKMKFSNVSTGTGNRDVRKDEASLHERDSQSQSAASENATSSRHEWVSRCQVTTSIEPLPITLSTFPHNGKVPGTKLHVCYPQGSVPQPDKDSGRGDSEPDSSSFVGSTDREYQKPPEQLWSEYKLKYDRPVFASNSRCTEECDRMGHSDSCWMPSPDFETNEVPSALPQHDFHSEYSRVLETIEETVLVPNPCFAYEYDPDVLRESCDRATAAGMMASYCQLSDNIPGNDVCLYNSFPHHCAPARENVYDGGLAESEPLSSTPLSGTSDPVLSRVSYSQSSSSRDNNVYNTGYVSLRGRNHSDVTGSVTMRETQAIIEDIDKLLTSS